MKSYTNQFNQTFTVGDIGQRIVIGEEPVEVTIVKFSASGKNMFAKDKNGKEYSFSTKDKRERKSTNFIDFGSNFGVGGRNIIAPNGETITIGDKLRRKKTRGIRKGEVDLVTVTRFSASEKNIFTKFPSDKDEQSFSALTGEERKPGSDYIKRFVFAEDQVTNPQVFDISTSQEEPEPDIGGTYDIKEIYIYSSSDEKFRNLRFRKDSTGWLPFYMRLGPYFENDDWDYPLDLGLTITWDDDFTWSGNITIDKKEYRSFYDDYFKFKRFIRQKVKSTSKFKRWEKERNGEGRFYIWQFVDDDSVVDSNEVVEDEILQEWLDKNQRKIEDFVENSSPEMEGAFNDVIAALDNISKNNEDEVNVADWLLWKENLIDEIIRNSDLQGSRPKQATRIREYIDKQEKRLELKYSPMYMYFEDEQSIDWAAAQYVELTHLNYLGQPYDIFLDSLKTTLKSQGFNIDDIDYNIARDMYMSDSSILNTAKAVRIFSKYK